ncbi:protein dj-1beta [Onthophagus taurus]|uniref:protein dj-1beta n=1 Tax=Onthophagus taurus TaxID=166361 RepID=UPI000C200FAC|nr:protein dj-1beta [Onthophagus taurus]
MFSIALKLTNNRLFDQFKLKTSTSLLNRVLEMSKCPIPPKTALVFLAEGAEEMEFVIAADVLRRAGIGVTVAGIPDNCPILCSRDIVIKPDIGIAEALKKDYDALVLPGGLGGSKALSCSLEVGKMLKKQEERGDVIAAICAAPTALKAHSIALGKRITSYPTVKEQLIEGGLYSYLEDKVVVDSNVITSRGPGTAYDFALAIVEKLVGKEKASEVARAMLIKY